MRRAARMGEGGKLGNWRSEMIEQERRGYFYFALHGDRCKHSIHPDPFDSQRVGLLVRKSGKQFRRSFHRLFAFFALSSIGPCLVPHCSAPFSNRMQETLRV